MILADLVFICVFLATIALLLVAAVSARRLSILRWLGIGLGIYFTIVVVISILLPRKIVAIGENQCFDDWCAAVDRVDRSRTGANVSYTVAIRLNSRARRVAQRENNLSVYITGTSGERYEALPDATAVPFNVLLHPGESVATNRTFVVPANIPAPALVITHAGGFPIGWFIIGYDTWFRKPPILPLTTRISPAA